MNPAASTLGVEPLVVTRDGPTLCLRLAGEWSLLTPNRPAPGVVQAEFAQFDRLPETMRFDLTDVTHYDLSLIHI